MICLGVQHSTAHTHVVQSKYISHFVMSPFISCFVLYPCIPSMSIGFVVFFLRMFPDIFQKSHSLQEQQEKASGLQIQSICRIIIKDLLSGAWSP